eukprot:2035086-Amphidinium_carterae.1
MGLQNCSHDSGVGLGGYPVRGSARGRRGSDSGAVFLWSAPTSSATNPHTLMTVSVELDRLHTPM